MWVLTRYFEDKRRLKARSRELYAPLSGAQRALIALLVAAALVAGAALGAAAMAEGEPVLATVYVHVSADSYLQGRSTPSTKGQVEARFMRGDALEVVEYGGEWIRVIGGESGTVWVYGDYVRASEPDAEPTTYTVTGNGRVHVRQTPEPDGAHVRWAEVGEAVTVYGMAGGYAQIDGGYINADYLEAQDDPESEDNDPA